MTKKILQIKHKDTNNKVSLITGGKSDNWERQKHDFYATPTETTKSILEVEELEGSILECACGMGHISKVLKEYYPNNEIVSTDKYDYGYGTPNIDFLTYDFGRKFDNIITNPPFRVAKEFVERALQLSNNKVLMLMKIQFLESQGRKEFLENSPLKYVYCFSERQSTMRDGLEFNPKTNKPWSTAFFLAWFVWEKDYKEEPIIKWL